MTDTDPLAFVAGDHLYTHRVDRETGALTELHVAETEEPPSFLALHPDGEHLYAVWGGEGTALAYDLDPETGAVSELNRQPTENQGPCHCAVDATGQYLLVAHYQGGGVAMLPIAEDGTLDPVSDQVQHEGSGPNEERQEAPHPHSINPGPDNRIAYVPDLGIDEVVLYEMDLAAGELVPADLPAVELHGGAGPRHFDVHPSEEYAYLINELDSTVTAFERDTETGALAAIETESTLPAEFAEKNKTADIHVHPSGDWVYGSNRGHDSIAVFAVEATGGIERQAIVSTGGEWPRNFGMDPAGQYLFAENRDTDDITTFDIDDGDIAANGAVADVPQPICMVFLERA
jgi:6-phosphogluconolactonase